MSWIVTLLFWTAAPFVELGVIIALLVSNDRYKRKLREAERAVKSLALSRGNGEKGRAWEPKAQCEPPGTGELETRTWQEGGQRKKTEAWRECSWVQNAEPSKEESCQQKCEPSRGEERQRNAELSKEESCQQNAEPSKEEGCQQNIRPSKEEGCQQNAGPSKGEGCQQNAGSSKGGGCQQNAEPSKEEGCQQNAGPSKEESCQQNAEPSKEEGRQQNTGPSREEERQHKCEPLREETRDQKPGLSWKEAGQRQQTEGYSQREYQAVRTEETLGAETAWKEDGGKAYRKGKGAQRAVRDSVFGSLGIIALILGMVLIILAGLIFATTTWHILSDVNKTALVLGCAAVFFLVSFMAERLFHIHRTSSAFYVLGSAFLFLTVVAAAYFQLLGPEFILDGENRWKVLWVGSLVVEISFFAGLKRFGHRIYTQASLWGVSVSLFFLARAFSLKWNGFLSMMMIYACLLIIIRKFLENGQPGEAGSVRGILADGFRSFAPVQFWFFGGLVMIRGLTAEIRMVTEIAMGVSFSFLDRFSLFCFTVPGMAAMAALVGGLWFLKTEKWEKIFSWILRAAAVESAVYMAGVMFDSGTWRMLAVNLMFLGVYMFRYRKKGEEEKVSLFWDICGCGALLITLRGFYSCREESLAGLMCCLGAFWGYYVWFYRGERQLPHLLASVAALPLPFAARSGLGLTSDQMWLGMTTVLLLWGAAARCFYPVAQEDSRVQGGWRLDWFWILSILDILVMAVTGDARWRFAGILMAALYFWQYRTVKTLERTVLTLSACLLAAAVWQQPFILWPAVLKLEMMLLPAAWLIWALGVIWGRNPWLGTMQLVGYVTCLFLLCQDAFRSGQVTDALILEGICLAIFLWAQIKKNVLWVRISGGLILLAAVFLTRDFWLSISWWVYLLAAGVGLMVFAAVMEKNRRT